MSKIKYSLKPTKSRIFKNYNTKNNYNLKQNLPQTESLSKPTLRPLNSLSASSYGILLYNSQNISFQGRKYRNAQDVERMLKKRRIKSNFKDNDLVADSSYKMVKVFDYIFGKRSLPKKIGFCSFEKEYPDYTDATGLFDPEKIGVFFNSDDSSYESIAKLKITKLKNKLILWHGTGSYLSTFAHEMGHCAHYKHLCDSASDIYTAAKCWDALGNTKVPTFIGRMITHFSIGEYANKDMLEHLANRVAKDVCSNYDSKNEFFEGDREDLDYSDIFDRKWGELSVLHPQSYIDYYTQQVWNAADGGTVDNNGKYHKEEVAYIDRKAREFLAMAKKIAKEDNVPLEQVNLKKVKKALKQKQQSLELASLELKELLEPLEQTVLRRRERHYKEEEEEEYVYEPIRQAIIEPIKERIVEPIKKEVIEPIKESIPKPIKQQVVEPIIHYVTEPIQENIVEPIKDLASIHTFERVVIRPENIKPIEPKKQEEPKDQLPIIVSSLFSKIKDSIEFISRPLVETRNEHVFDKINTQLNTLQTNRLQYYNAPKNRNQQQKGRLY